MRRRAFIAGVGAAVAWLIAVSTAATAAEADRPR
jgi:hypothetical protein